MVRNIEYMMEILHNKPNQVLFHVGVIVWKFLIIYKSIMFSSELWTMTTTPNPFLLLNAAFDLTWIHNLNILICTAIRIFIYTIILLFCILKIHIIMLGRPYPIFNYLTFTVAIHKVSGQDSSEVKSYIFRKKKCMIIFCCAQIF